ncbi:NACHT domain-containing protein [Methylobacterium soli]|uniref:NACHT domain-containing protein n=2 Tax=Methylobacterium soli TaxID=553447 RepID=A0A6L3SW89_9HYPH|nr:NACHT domain-containing protein [Methylobacterium soli]KAB1077189.1 NACHT domain-containing protein [Methylobacterium soli]GJE46955.1 hypothetical protein AEGHOMDF_6164 [Methylobacterium soli]
MTSDLQEIADDLSPFADLGTEAPTIISNANNGVIRFIKDGDPVELIVHTDGALFERTIEQEKKFVDLRSLLASPSYADLGRWADSQVIRLSSHSALTTIPLFGQSRGSDEQSAEAALDQLLFNEKASKDNSVNVVLLDGPAGIGKTTLIRSLSLARAKSYRQNRKPLLLHVESRGRVLQNILDLMAFSLQNLRVKVTYDQIPTLIKHGLIVLAIDGFDELGDPNGYDLAWAQVNSLVEKSRGAGNILLSGRETFISPERLSAALTSLRSQSDSLHAFTLQHTAPNVATRWLKENGWSDEMLKSEISAPLFESGSYALRPFFLTHLAREETIARLQNEKIDDLLTFLMIAMIEREATKFGSDVEAITTPDQRKQFIQNLMEETARDLAENQTEAISGEYLSWLAEIAATDTVPTPLVGVLKNRASVIAFLTEDDRRGYRRFIHGQVLNYFLASAAINSLAEGEVPKFVRRNILGMEFLQNFSEVVRHKPEHVVEAFLTSAGDQLQALGNHDRSRANIAVLIMAAASVHTVPESIKIFDLSIDDAYLSETVSSLKLGNVSIAQLDVRNADLTKISFRSKSHILTLIADDSTAIPDVFPHPLIVQLPERTLTNPEHIADWIAEKQVKNSGVKISLEQALSGILKFGLFDLLGRLSRYKPFWIRDGDEKSARRILDDPHWEKLRDIMLRHDVLVERTDVAASGPRAPFYHVRNRQTLSRVLNPPHHLKPFIEEVFSESIKIFNSEKNLEDEGLE